MSLSINTHYLSTKFPIMCKSKCHVVCSSCPYFKVGVAHTIGIKGPLGGATRRPIIIQFTGCEQPDQCSHWPENAVDWLRNAICVARNVLLRPGSDLSGPTVHSLYCCVARTVPDSHVTVFCFTISIQKIQSTPNSKWSSLPAF